MYALRAYINQKKKKNSATKVLYNRDDGEWKRVFLTFIANKE